MELDAPIARKKSELPLEVVPTQTSVLTIASPGATSHVKLEISPHSVITLTLKQDSYAEQPKTLPPTTAEKLGKNTSEQEQSALAISPFCAAPTIQPEESNDQTTCSIKGCDSKGQIVYRRVNGIRVPLCASHSHKLTVTGTLYDAPIKRRTRRPEGIDECQVEDCANDARYRAKDLWVCSKHYLRNKTHGSFDDPASRSNNPAISTDSGAQVGEDTPQNGAHRLAGGEQGRLSHNEQNSPKKSHDGLTDDEISSRFGGIIEQAAHAFMIDASYAASIISRARMHANRTAGIS